MCTCKVSGNLDISIFKVCENAIITSQVFFGLTGQERIGTFRAEFFLFRLLSWQISTVKISFIMKQRQKNRYKNKYKENTWVNV